MKFHNNNQNNTQYVRMHCKNDLMQWLVANFCNLTPPLLPFQVWHVERSYQIVTVAYVWMEQPVKITTTALSASVSLVTMEYNARLTSMNASVIHVRMTDNVLIWWTSICVTVKKLVSYVIFSFRVLGFLGSSFQHFYQTLSRMIR